MRLLGPIGALSVLLTALTTQAAAQTLPGAASTPNTSTFEIVPLSADQDRELTQWLTAMDKWQQYDTKWQNRPVHNEWAHIVERTPSPGAPAWLAARCASLTEAHVLDLDSRTASACRLLDDPRVPQAAATARPAVEKPPPHSSFATRIHLDALATTSE